MKSVEYGVSFEDYAQREGVNLSRLKHMDESPAHYLAAPRIEPTDAMELGTATHIAILEPDRLSEAVAFWDEGDGPRAKARKGKEWEAFKAEHAGKVLLRTRDQRPIEQMALAVQRHPDARRLVEGLRTEVVYEWTDEPTGIRCKGRVDGRKPGITVDLKTSRSLNAYAFGSQAAKLMYHVQAAHYWEGVKAVDGENSRYFILAVENVEPYDVGVFRVDPATLRLGRDKRRELMSKLARCLEANEWPGRYPEAVDLDLPSWVWPDDEEFILEG